jgi:parallel beta-helix repeat protein
VGVDVAGNAADTLLTRNRFVKNRVSVRFAAAAGNSSVDHNHFTEDKDAGLWAVRGTADSGGEPVNVHDNHFAHEPTGIVAGNVPILIERNDFSNSRAAAVHLVGAAAVVRGNRISGGESMGVVAESARDAVIEGNEIDGMKAYGIMVRSSANTLVRKNRIHNSSYGIAFVLGQSSAPSTAVENIVMEPQLNGIDVLGDSPILRRNQVIRPHGVALHVENFRPQDGQTIQAQPFLDNNTFGAGGAPLAVTRPAEPGAQRR